MSPHRDTVLFGVYEVIEEDGEKKFQINSKELCPL
ncbi:MAG: hypothetical protein Ct9H90mP4_06130 [Gammaproteobacteria bacterium]|nr:MAG: hypothetical protein Ct9H90mP4_06130 [Gammaproteobacteria bacterium]